MPLFKKKTTRSPEFFGDLLFPVGDLPARAVVYLRVAPEERRICFKRAGEESSLPYRRLIGFTADNEQRIRDGESPVPSEALSDLPRLSDDSLTRMEQNVRFMSTRWFGELKYEDEEGSPCSVIIMERKRSGYNLDVIKSLQATEMEKFINGMASGE